MTTELIEALKMLRDKLHDLNTAQEVLLQELKDTVELLKDEVNK